MESDKIVDKSFKQKVWHVRHTQLVTNGTVIMILNSWMYGLTDYVCYKI